MRKIIGLILALIGFASSSIMFDLGLIRNSFYHLLIIPSIGIIFLGAYLFFGGKK